MKTQLNRFLWRCDVVRPAEYGKKIELRAFVRQIDNSKIRHLST